ncbi:TetR/AcrR family transcriptional regulator [Pseudonocardia halophobica]|uniref:TetR/AcrR family transcriptional regulator n=1 Tax=Pseudonocardia halophobica TaxID=29401 RepID=UPI003D8D607A
MNSAAEETGRRILDAAFAAFGEDLYDQVSLQVVAARAGVTVQTVIRRFGSKDELYAALARWRSEQIRSARDATPTGDVGTAVEHLAECYERWGADVLNVLAQERRSAAMAEVAENGRRYHRDWVARVFASQLAKREETELVGAQLAAVTDLYTWVVLRRHSGLDRQAATVAMRGLVDAVLRAGECGRVRSSPPTRRGTVPRLH